MATATATRTPRKRTKMHQPRAGVRAQTTRQEARRKAIPRGITQRAATLLKMIADPTRLNVLMILAEGEQTVSGLCRSIGAMSQPAVSHHIALIRHGCLIEPRREGKFNFYRLTPLGRTLARLAAPLVESAP